MKTFTSPANEFILYTVEAIEKFKKESFHKIVQVQLISFCYMNVEKNRKM